MSKLTHKTLTAVVKSIDEAAHTVTAIISTPSVDRDREIILPTAFMRSLASYLKNPIFLWGHKWFGGPENALGTCISLEVVPEGLQATFRYAVEANPVAKQVFDLVVAGVLRAFSVGFLPIKALAYWSDEDELATLPPDIRKLLEDREAYVVHVDAELVEVSQVLIPSNREAIVAAEARGLVSPEFASKALSILEADEGAAVADLGIQRFHALKTAEAGNLVLQRIEKLADRLERLAGALGPVGPAVEVRVAEPEPAPAPALQEKAPADMTDAELEEALFRALAGN